MALTKDRNTHMMDGELIPVPVAADAVIFAGALTVANASGFAAPGSAAATLTSIGRAEMHVDNTGGANGDKDVLVRRGRAFRWANDATDPVTQADFGKPCYIVDDETVSGDDDDAGRSEAGIVLGVDEQGVWVL